MAYEQQVQDVEAQVESEKKRVDGQLDDLRRQVNEGNSRSERGVERVQSQLADHSSDIAKIKNKVNGRSSEMVQVKMKMDHHSGEIAHAMRKAVGNSGAIEQVKRQVDSHSSEQRKLKDQVDALQRQLQEMLDQQARMKDEQKDLVETLKQQDQQMRHQRAQMMNQAPQIVIHGDLNVNMLGNARGDQGAIRNFATNLWTRLSRMNLRGATIEDADSDSETEDIQVEGVLYDYKEY